MKSLARKTLWSTAILTIGFALALLCVSMLAQEDHTKLVVLATLVMGIAVVASALIWASGSADSDNRHDKRCIDRWDNN
jgi:hypothetical protein